MIAIFFTLSLLLVLMLQIMWQDYKQEFSAWVGVLDFDPLIFHDQFNYQFIFEHSEM